MIQSLQIVKEQFLRKLFSRMEIEEAKYNTDEYDELDLMSNYIAYCHFVDNTDVYVYFDSNRLHTNINTSNHDEKIKLIKLLLLVMENFPNQANKKHDFNKLYNNLFEKFDKDVVNKVVVNKLKSLKDYYIEDYYNFETRLAALLNQIIAHDIFDASIVNAIKDVCNSTGVFQIHSIYLKLEIEHPISYILLKEATKRCESLAELKRIMVKGNQLEIALTFYAGYVFQKNRVLIDKLNENISNPYFKDSLIEIYYRLGMDKEIASILEDSIDNLIDLPNCFNSLVRAKRYDLLNRFIPKYNYYQMDKEVFALIEGNCDNEISKKIIDNYPNKNDISMLAYFQKYDNVKNIEKLLDKITIEEFASQIDILSKFDTNLYYYSKKIRSEIYSYNSKLDDLARYIKLLEKFKYGFLAGVFLYTSYSNLRYSYRAKQEAQRLFKNLSISVNDKVYSFFQVIDPSSLFESYNENENTIFKIDIFKNFYDIISCDEIIRPYQEAFELVLSFKNYIYDSRFADMIVTSKFNISPSLRTYAENDLNIMFGLNARAYLNTYIEKNKERMQLEMQEAILEYERQELEKKKKADAKYLEDLIKKLDEVSETKLQSKVHLYPIIFKRDSNYSLELKVGINKFYKIKGIPSLIENVIDSKTFRYGKELEFNHDLENFDEESQKLLRMLMPFSDYYQSVKEVPLNSIMLQDIISNYKDRYIAINDKYMRESVEYFVSLDYVDSNLIINKEDQIDCVECDCYLYGYNKTYIAKDGVINVIKFNSNKERTIYNSITEKNQPIDFSNIKKKFKNEIFSRISNKVDVDEEAEKDFHLAKIKIESYYDYDDGVINHVSKYYSDGKEVTLDEIKQMNHVSDTLTRYEDISKSLGIYNEEVNDSSVVAGFLRSDLGNLKDVCDVYISENLKAVKVRKLEKTRFAISSIEGVIKINAIELTYSNEELALIVKALRKKKKFVKLDKNTIIEVDDKTAFELLSAIDDFDLDENHLNDEKEIEMYQLMKLENEVEYDLDIEENVKMLLEEIANYKNSNVMVSDRLKTIMREYQIDAFKWLKMLEKFNFSGILADDMGLGKSIEVISLLESTTNALPSLIVCPKSLIFNWKHEFGKWLDYDMCECVVGSTTERKQIIANIKEEKKFYIISYDTYRNDQELFKDILFDYCILDEAQFIKNHSTLKARSVRTINANHKLCLTGTPIENSVLDLWSIFDFLMPGYLGNYNRFKGNYEKNLLESESKSNRLLKKITPFILRRTKEDVLSDLPEKIETILSCEMGDEQRKTYEAQVYKTIEEVGGHNKISILSALTRLRQICVEPSMFIEDYQGGSSKMELLKQTIETNIADNHRMLIFSQFTSVFNIIEKYLEENNIKYFKITGETNSDDRMEYCNIFNENEEYKVFLISLKAGGTGLNLTGADTVIHLDPWWNVSAQNQATDRAHRIGQTNTVRVFKLICANSIEEKVLLLQEKKKEVIDKLIKNDDSNITSLSKDDIMFLLS